MSEVECAVCHRLEFGDAELCGECHWPLRPIAMVDAYGFDVCVEVRRGNLLTQPEARHYKGSEATARRRAKLVPGFVRVLALRPLSERQWINAYGEGRM